MFGELLGVMRFLSEVYDRQIDFFLEGGAAAASLDLNTVHLFHPNPSGKLKVAIEKAREDKQSPFRLVLEEQPCIDLFCGTEGARCDIAGYIESNPDLGDCIEAMVVCPALVSFRIRGGLEAARAFSSRILSDLSFITRGEILAAQDGEIFKFCRPHSVPASVNGGFRAVAISRDDILDLRIALGIAAGSKEFIDMMFK